MSTTISGTNGVTFPDSTSMQTGQQACKAWVNFNGTGTVAIRAAYNVSSITDNGTADYRVNFTTAMPDANYVVSGTAMRNGTSGEGSAGLYIVPFGSTTYSNAMNSGSARIRCKLLQTFEDPLAVQIAIFSN